ncbi:hypothetical protein [Succinimonas sp.]|uniref:hypothetical protein n=1 Tax=Succinimonas sp. TaxID=1936151 RepID=UPI0038631D9C
MKSEKTENSAGDSESRAKDAKATIDKVIKQIIFFGEENLKKRKKIMTLAEKLYKCSDKLAEVQVELDHPGKAGAYLLIAKDGLCRDYVELKKISKSNVKTCQGNLEYFKELHKDFADYDKKSDSQQAELLSKLYDIFERAESNFKTSRENLVFWQKDFDELQRDYRKNQIKLLRRRIAEYKRKLPAAEKKLSRLLEEQNKKS